MVYKALTNVKNSSTPSTSIFNVTELIKNVIADDIELLKYLPGSLLNEEQNSGRQKLFITDELAGQMFTATDDNGYSHNIKIADKSKFRNKSGKMVNSYKDLIHYTEIVTKQDAIANTEEIILAASFVKRENATHRHDCLMTMAVTSGSFGRPIFRIKIIPSGLQI